MDNVILRSLQVVQFPLELLILHGNCVWTSFTDDDLQTVLSFFVLNYLLLYKHWCHFSEVMWHFHFSLGWILLSIKTKNWVANYAILRILILLEKIYIRQRPKSFCYDSVSEFLWNNYICCLWKNVADACLCLT